MSNICETGQSIGIQPETKKLGQKVINNQPPSVCSDLLRFINSPLITKPNFCITVIEESKRFNRGYQAWQTLRYSTKERKTGFEGYFVGQNLNPDEIAMKIAEMGKWQLQRLGTDPSFKREVLGVLAGRNVINPAVWLELDSMFAALLAISKAEMITHPPAQNFRANTYFQVDRVNPGITYTTEGPKITRQIYTIPIIPLIEELLPPQSVFTEREVNDPGHQFGIMSSLGMMGHPLSRRFLEEAVPDNQTYWRFKKYCRSSIST